MKSTLIEDTADRITERAVQVSSTQVVPEDSVLVVTRSGILRHSVPAGLAGRPLAINQDLKAILPGPGHDARYLRYFIESHQAVLLSLWRREGTTVESLETDLIRATEVPLPPLPTQRAIAAHLDRETARIDRLIEKKERLLQLLEEKRTALITHAVTKGHDPDVPMKDSGARWLGEVPAHWEVGRVRRFVSVIDCRHVTPQYVKDGYPLVSTTEVKAGILDLSACTRFVGREAFDYMTEGGRLPRPGDIVYSRNASLGAAAYVDTRTAFCMGQDVVLIRCEAGDGQYLSMLLNSPAVTGQVDLIGVGSTFSRINVAAIRDLLIAWPPQTDQRAIVSFAGARTEAVSSLHHRVTRAIHLLREYRSALISAAVTGQLDIPDDPSTDPAA